MPFIDFQVRAWQDGAGRAKILVHCSPAGEMRRPVDVPLIPEPLERLREIFQGRMWISDGPAVRAEVIGLGQQLSQTLLPTPVFVLLLRSLERLGPGQGLRLRLCLDPPLSDVPWEFLYRPDVTEPDSLSGFLVLDSRISMIREAPTNIDPIPLSQGRQRLVFAGTYWAGKNGVLEDRWNIRSEYEATESEPNRLKDLLTVELYDASSESFENALLQPAAILHYSGHTDVADGRGYLARRMEDPDRVSMRMYSEELGLLLRKAETRLGVFSACNSGRWAFAWPLLHENRLRALVGVQDTVSAVGSIAFVKKLYSTLAVELSLDEAVTWARLHILLESPDPEKRGRASYEWAAFKVFMNSAEPVLLPQPDRLEVREGRQQVQDERHQTIINVHQTIGTNYGPFTGVSAGQITGS